MPTLEFQSTVAAPIEKVWAFFDDPRRGLEALSPAEAQVRVESADVPVKVGSRVVVSVVVPWRGRVRWVAKIVEHRPPHAVVFGQEARFVDEQEEGPFAAWRHEHELEAIDSKTTRVVDRVSYRVPLGPIGWLADAILVRRRVRRMFEHRRNRVKELLEE